VNPFQTSFQCLAALQIAILAPRALAFSTPPAFLNFPSSNP